jgi:hypothetical protein
MPYLGPWPLRKCTRLDAPDGKAKKRERFPASAENVRPVPGHVGVNVRGDWRGDTHREREREKKRKAPKRFQKTNKQQIGRLAGIAMT